MLSIDAYPLTDRPRHPRIAYLHGDPTADSTAAQVKEIVGEPPRSLVVLSGAAGPKVEGNPVWPEFGSGPAVAVQQIIDAGDFVHDPFFERFGLTFNVGGFLRRVP